MKKVLWIILIILLVIWFWVWWFYAYKFFTRSECQDQIDECCHHVKSFYAWGWMMVVPTGNWRTNMDDKCDDLCPKDCSQYTEERWYFKDDEKQQEYYDNAVKECEKEYEECLKTVTWYAAIRCHECDRFWQPIHYWN